MTSFFLKITNFIRKILVKTDLNRNVLTLLTGNILAQAIPVVASPIIARIYGPEELGLFSLFLAFTGISALAISFSYEWTIMLPKVEGHADQLLWTSCIVSVGMSVILFITILIFDEKIAFLVSEPKFKNWLYVIPIATVFSGITQSVGFWYNRKAAFVKLTQMRILQSVTSTIGQIAMGIIKISGGLIWGWLIGLIIYSSKIIVDIFEEKVPLKKKYQIPLLKKYKKFALTNTVSNLFNGASNMGLPIVIGLLFPLKIVGAFYLANRVIRLPLDMLFRSYGQVYQQKANHLIHTNPKELLTMTKGLQRKFIKIMIPFLIVTSLISPYIFAFVFGEEWREAGELVKYFSILIFFNLIHSPVSSIGVVLRKEKTILIFNIVLSLSQIIGFWILSKIMMFKYALFIVSMVSGSLYYLLDNYMLKTLRERALGVDSCLKR